VPIKDGDRVGASDPMTALLIYVGGTGITTVPQACERTVAIFDGHTRYNLRLAFERFGTAHPVEGYQGPVVVCSAKFLPVAGYDPKHFLVTYLAAPTRNRNLARASWQHPAPCPIPGLHFNAHGGWHFGGNKICVFRGKFARRPLNQLGPALASISIILH
jgi:hypothetical protein